VLVRRATGSSVSLPYFDLKTDGGAVADWNGTTGTNAAPAFAAAWAVFVAAGGGTLYIPNGDYFVDRVAGAGQSTVAILALGCDNVTIIWGPKATLHFTDTTLGPLVVHGAVKKATYNAANWFEYQTTIPVSPITSGAIAITALNAAHVTALGLAAGDIICVRTGQTIGGQTHVNPDSEMVEVDSVAGATINLKSPVIKDYAQEYFPTPGTPTTLTAQANGGDTSIQVADASTFAANDYITIGNAGGVMQMTQVFGAPVGNVINIKGSIRAGLSIPSGAIVHKGSGGPTTTGANGAPAVFGLSKVTDIAIKNVKLVNPRIDAPASPGNQFEQIFGLVVEGGDNTLKGGFAVCNNVRGVRIKEVPVKHPSTNANGYSLAFGRGSSEIEIERTALSSAGHAGIVFSEGTVIFRVAGGSVKKPALGVAGRQSIAVQTRSGYGVIDGVDLEGGPTDYVIGVEANCTRGGVIDNCAIRSTATNAGYLKSSGWTWGRGNRVIGSAKVRSDSTGSPLHIVGSGTPESNYTAPVGSTYIRTDGGTGTTFYVKETGSGNTGWVAFGAPGAGGGGAFTVAVAKTADENVAASTVLQSDDELLFAIGSSATEIWFFEAFLTVAAPNTAMGAKYGLVGPAAATALWGLGGGVAATGKAGFNATGTLAAALAIGGTTGAMPSLNGTWLVYLAGWVYGGGTPGNVAVQWAQNTSDAGNLTVKKGSYLRAQKIAT
jgi:hypothetical protein